MHSVLEMQDYKESGFTPSLVLSVLLTSRVKVILHLTQVLFLSKMGKAQSPVHCGLQVAAPAAFRCMKSAPVMNTLSPFWHYDTTRRTNISGHAITKQGLEIKSVITCLTFLCCFISTCSEGMWSWVLTGLVGNMMGPHSSLAPTCGRCWKHAPSCTGQWLQC